MKKFLALLLLLPALVFGQNRSVVSLLTFGADPTGNADISTAFTHAEAVAKTIIVPPGKYLLNGTATVALSNIDIECEGTTANANNSYGASGATFLLTSTSVQPFTVASGVRIHGCNFYWPNQTGGSSTPTAYPPLFTEPSGSNLSNFDLDHDRIVNAYDVLDQAACTTSDAFGNIHLTATYGYAIRYWLSLCNVAETMTITGMSADWNLYQNVANASPNYYLVKWTAANGAFLHVFGNGNGSTTASTVQVGGIVYSGAVFAYNKFIWVDSTGYLNESMFHGIADAVPHALQIDSGGCAGQVQMDMEYYSYQWNPPSGGTGGADNATTFSMTTPSSGFSGCTITSMTLKGQLESAQGDVLDLSGAYIRTVALHLTGSGTYANTSTAGTYYFANINGANVGLDAEGNYLQPKTAGSSAHGFYLQACYQCTINGNTFNGVYAPIASPTSSTPISAVGNVSGNTPSGGSLVGTGTFGHLFLTGNSWDANALPAPSVGTCGTSPTLNGGSTDISGSVAVGSGTVTACTITFANSYAIGPKCFATTGVGAASIAATSATAVTFGFPNDGGGSLWYQCIP